jgi:hypothetical protein
MTWAEYLKSQGANDEAIKVLDTSDARKAFDVMQAEATAARNEGKAAKDKAEADRVKLETWFRDVATPEYKELERRAITAEAEAGKAKAAWQAAQERGLIDIAQLEALGYKKETTPTTIAAPAGGFDEKAWNQRLIDMANGAGDGLAAMQDIVLEHNLLFPDKPLRVRELRAEAVKAGKNIDVYWSEKYSVPAARDAREKKIKDEYETKLRKEGHDAAVLELAGKYANPETRPLMPSSNPFTVRKDSGRNVQPWQRQDDASVDRVVRATQKLIERTNSTAMVQ